MLCSLKYSHSKLKAWMLPFAFSTPRSLCCLWRSTLFMVLPGLPLGLVNTKVDFPALASSLCCAPQHAHTLEVLNSGSTLYYLSFKHVSKFSEPSLGPLWKRWKNTPQTFVGIACFQIPRTSWGLEKHPFPLFWLLYPAFVWCSSIVPYANFLVSFSTGIADDQTKHFLSISRKEGTSQYIVNGDYLLHLLTVKIPFDFLLLSLNCAVRKIKPSFSRENCRSHFLVSFQGALSSVLKCSAQCSWIHLLYCFIFLLIQFY